MNSFTQELRQTGYLWSFTRVNYSILVHTPRTLDHVIIARDRSTTFGPDLINFGAFSLARSLSYRVDVVSYSARMGRPRKATPARKFFEGLGKATGVTRMSFQEEIKRFVSSFILLNYKILHYRSQPRVSPKLSFCYFYTLLFLFRGLAALNYILWMSWSSLQQRRNA